MKGYKGQTAYTQQLLRMDPSHNSLLIQKYILPLFEVVSMPQLLSKALGHYFQGTTTVSSYGINCQGHTCLVKLNSVVCAIIGFSSSSAKWLTYELMWLTYYLSMMLQDRPC